MPQRGQEYLRGDTKRRLDLIGGLAIAAATGPLGLAATVAAAVDTRSYKPIFVQNRLIGDGKILSTLKIRTMPEVSDNEPVQTNGVFDARASRFGQLLRQTGIDELPQALSVVAGTMSLVGPRPAVESDLQRYQEADGVLFEEWYEQYQQVKPGLTGESQLWRRQFNGIDDAVRIGSMWRDMHYFETADLATDLSLVAHTPIAMLQANLHVEDVASQ